MTTSGVSSINPIQRAHSGGFFWTVNRSRRVQVILEMAARLRKVVIIAGSESEASDIAERLTLRGLPVLLAASVEGHQRPLVFGDSTGLALVTTAEYISEHGPISSPMTIHLRPPFSARSYTKRLKHSVSPVQITLVTPEDEQRADQLRGALSPHLNVDEQGVELQRVLELTRSAKPAVVDPPRRRFPFRQAPTKEARDAPTRVEA